MGGQKYGNKRDVKKYGNGICQKMGNTEKWDGGSIPVMG